MPIKESSKTASRCSERCLPTTLSAAIASGSITTTMETPAQFEPAHAPASSSTQPRSILFSGRVETAVLAVLLIVAFWPILIGIYGSWFDEGAYLEHGILVVPA